jgi:protein-disulfide isomerase
LLLLAGAAALAVVVVVVIVVALPHGSSGGATTSAVSTSGVAAQPEAVSTFAGVPQQGAFLGKASAAATLILYEDPQCPFCRQFNIDTLPTVVRNYVRTGKLRLEYRGIVVIGLNSVAGLRAIYGAAPQDKLWNMVEALYERQGDENSGWITVPVIRDAASEVGANAPKLLARADSAAVTATLDGNQKLAKSDRVGGTPTFVLQKQLGEPQQLTGYASLEPADFTPVLDAALQ